MGHTRVLHLCFFFLFHYWSIVIYRWFGFCYCWYYYCYPCCCYYCILVFVHIVGVMFIAWYHFCYQCCYLKKKAHLNHFFINELTNSLLPWDRVRCYGPGVEPSGPVVGAPTHFTIETFSAGKGKVEALLHKPDGQVENVSNCHGYGLSLVGNGIVGCVIMCTCRGRKG